MRITADTPDMLIVEERPWLMALLLTAITLGLTAIGLAMLLEGRWTGLWLLLAALVFGYGFMLVFVRRVQLVLFRPEGWAEIRRASFFGRKRVRHRLDEIDRAVIEESRSSDSTTYRVALVIENGQSAGRHPLTQYYSNVGHHHAIAEAINAWLAQTRHTGPAHK